MWLRTINFSLHGKYCTLALVHPASSGPCSPKFSYSTPPRKPPPEVICRNSPNLGFFVDRVTRLRFLSWFWFRLLMEDSAGPSDPPSSASQPCCGDREVIPIDKWNPFSGCSEKIAFLVGFSGCILVAFYYSDRSLFY